MLAWCAQRPCQFRGEINNEKRNSIQTLKPWEFTSRQAKAARSGNTAWHFFEDTALEKGNH
jgi:hypothetical protein